VAVILSASSQQLIPYTPMKAKADYIVSRDPHFRNLKHFHGVKIIDVKAFVERVRKG